MTPAVPWNSMELRVHQFRWHEQFHGIPWNLECANFADRSSSKEFHGTWNKPISMTRTVPWNSMELGVNQFRWHKQFHGIPWNFGCANFEDSSSSMEFHGIPWNLECANFADTRSSMEFHGTSSAPISMTRAVPWNSMELWVRQFRWLEQFHGIPWNLECANFADTRSSMARLDYVWFFLMTLVLFQKLNLPLHTCVVLWMHHNSLKWAPSKSKKDIYPPKINIAIVICID